jgi:hypothetical protein
VARAGTRRCRLQERPEEKEGPGVMR